jgi:eukaryotic-like serine/threonine-protein kinase
MSHGLPDLEKIKSALPQYRIVEVAGRGGMSIVYLVDHLILGQRRALKVLSPDLAEDESFRHRFIQESRTLVQLDHPHIVPVYDAGIAGGFLYLVMRYVEGPDLRKLLKREGPLSLERTTSIVRQIADALDSAHASDLIHRDVKPANVLVARSRDGGDRCYLSDFGLAKPAQSSVSLTGTGIFVGTPTYASPEQVTGGKLDQRSDLYSLGCLTYECLTGSPPFVRNSELATLWAHMNDAPPSASSSYPDLPAGIDAVLSRALAKEPSDRFERCSDLAAELEALCSSNQVDRPVIFEAGGNERVPESFDLSDSETIAAESPLHGVTRASPSVNETEAEPYEADDEGSSWWTGPVALFAGLLVLVTLAFVIYRLLFTPDAQEAAPPTPSAPQVSLAAPGGASEGGESCSSATLVARSPTSGSAGQFRLAQTKPDMAIGTFGDRTGPNAPAILPSHQGMELAIKQANARGDLPVNLLFKALDNPGGKGETAPPLAQQLIDDPQVIAVLGGAFSPEVQATGEMLGKAGMLNISAIATRSSLTGSGFRTFFRGIPSDDVQGSAMIRAFDFLGCRRVAILSDERAYSQGLASAASKQAGAVGMEVVVEREHPTGSSWGPQIESIIQAQPDAVFYAGYAPEFIQLAKLLHDGGYRGLVASGDGSKVPGLPESIGVEAAEGILLTCPCPDINRSTSNAGKQFVEDFSAAYGKKPGSFAAEGYDVANVAVAAIRECGEDAPSGITRSCVVDKVRTGSHEGVTKTFEFAPNGEIRNNDMVLYMIKDGQFKEVGLVEDLN